MWWTNPEHEGLRATVAVLEGTVAQVTVSMVVAQTSKERSELSVVMMRLLLATLTTTRVVKVGDYVVAIAALELVVLAVAVAVGTTDQ